mgnify:CR=1 FL=1
MIRKYMIVGLTVLSLAAVTACGSKKDTAVNNAAGNIEQSTESATVAKAKDIQMQVKDADGNTVTLTGDATINEAGEMVFEGKDSAGNVVKVTGTAEKTEDGGFKVKRKSLTVPVLGAYSSIRLKCFSDAFRFCTIRIYTSGAIARKQIGRASCRERV